MRMSKRLCSCCIEGGRPWLCSAGEELIATLACLVVRCRSGVDFARASVVVLIELNAGPHGFLDCSDVCGGCFVVGPAFPLGSLCMTAPSVTLPLGGVGCFGGALVGFVPTDGTVGDSVAFCALSTAGGAAAPEELPSAPPPPPRS